MRFLHWGGFLIFSVGRVCGKEQTVTTNKNELKNNPVEAFADGTAAATADDVMPSSGRVTSDTVSQSAYAEPACDAVSSTVAGAADVGGGASDDRTGGDPCGGANISDSCHCADSRGGDGKDSKKTQFCGGENDADGAETQFRSGENGGHDGDGGEHDGELDGGCGSSCGGACGGCMGCSMTDMLHAPRPASDTKQTVNHAERRAHKALLLRRLTFSAVFIALAVAAKLLLSFRIPLLGADGLRVSLAGVFTAFPAIVCGPVYGGVASAASDLIGHFVKPEGAYIPWLTVMAFVGGVMKGVIWRALSRERKRGAFRAAVLAVLIALGVLGVSSHIALASDGVINSLTVTAAELPTRGMTDRAEAEDRLGFISKTIVSLARYNNDTFTVLGASDADEVVLPSEAVLDGYRRPITKLGSGALADCAEMTRLVIPAAYKAAGLPADALGELDASRITVVGESGSGAQSFAESVGAAFKVSESTAAVSLELSSVGGVSEMESDGYTVRSSDTFRRNLSGYIAISTIGPEAVCIVGVLYLVLDSLITVLERRHGEGKRGIITPDFVRIAVSITLSGLLVTTVNTKILQEMLAVYAGRSFMILWIPRALEELVVCTAHSFIVAMLYGVFRRTAGHSGLFAPTDGGKQPSETAND